MIKKWNRDTCEIESKKFNRKIDWIKKSKGSYEVARLNGWLSDLSKHMVKEIKPFKVCQKCKISKKRCEFNQDYSVKNGLKSKCRECKKIENAKYRAIQNKEDKQKYMKEYSLKNKDKINSRVRQYRADNPEKIRLMQKIQSHKKLSKLNYRLSSYLRNRIRSALKKNSKVGSAIKDLGCSVEELRLHLQSKFKEGMSWDNWSRNGWHIDHIIPLSKFDLTNKDQFKKACHYTNLQPLWAKDNLKKYNKESNNV